MRTLEPHNPRYSGVLERFEIVGGGKTDAKMAVQK
jgi:hypothetical protein